MSITHRGRGKICMILLQLNRIKQNQAKNAINILRELDLVTFHMKDNLSDDGTSKIDVRMIMYNLQVRGTPCKCCSRSHQRSSPGLRLRLTALSVLIARVWWISHSRIFFIQFGYWCDWRDQKQPSLCCHFNHMFHALNITRSCCVFSTHRHQASTT